MAQTEWWWGVGVRVSPNALPFRDPNGSKIHWRIAPRGKEVVARRPGEVVGAVSNIWRCLYVCELLDQRSYKMYGNLRA